MDGGGSRRVSRSDLQRSGRVPNNILGPSVSLSRSLHNTFGGEGDGDDGDDLL